MDQQQQPTITGIRIRNVNDAHILFYAVSLNILPMIRRKLDPAECAQVRAGNCYIWEERSTDEETVDTGMIRWTDGLQWGPSRTRDEFLFYIHRSPDEAEGSRGRRRPQSVPSSNVKPAISPISTRPPVESSSGTSEEHKFVKQTYSVYTRLPSDSESRPLRKWHLVAYYTPHAVVSGELKDITHFPELMELEVPPGRFAAARVSRRGTTGSTRGSGVVPPPNLPGPAPTLEPPHVAITPSVPSISFITKGPYDIGDFAPVKSSV